MHATFQQIKFADADIVNAGEFIAANDSYNPRHIRPWLFHDHGFTIGVVFAGSLQDALDELADSGRLDRFAIAESDLADYGPEEEGIDHLGNAGEPFDIESLGYVELPNPAFSFVALFNAAQAG